MLFRVNFSVGILLLGGLLWLPGQAYAAPKVVVSVLPVHSLVAALMDGVGSPQLLIPGGQSPHASQLKPSQVGALGEADLVVWIGPALERSVGKIIAQRDGAAGVVTLLEHRDITLLSGRRGEDGHDDADDDDHGHDHDHDQWQMDPHLWLLFDNARAIARIVSGELVRLDPPNRERYESNARALLSRLDELRLSLGEQLRGVAGLRYVVFHDAYRYFEYEFDLQPAGFLTVSAQRPPGAKRIRQLRRLIQSQNIRCVFSEPQFQPELVNTLVADTDAVAGVLDPLGAGLEPGPEAWFLLMGGLADALTECAAFQ